MRIQMVRIGWFTVILVLASLAFAKLAIPNDVLGKLEAGLDYCAKVDSQSAAKYGEKKKTFVQGATAQELADARASKEYKDGYEAGTAEMEKQPKDQVKKACSDALEAKN